MSMILELLFAIFGSLIILNGIILLVLLSYSIIRDIIDDLKR